MGYVLDIIIAAIFAGFIYICAKRGFITVFYSFASTMIAVIAAISLAKVFVMITGGLFGLQGTLATGFTDTFAKVPGFDADVSGKDVTSLLATGDLPAIIANLVAKKYVNATLAAGTTLSMIVGDTMAELLTVLISAVILFGLFKALIFVLMKFCNFLSKKIGLVNAANRILGVVVGFVEGLLIISLVLSILALIPSPAMVAFFERSLILKLLYNHNPIVAILGWFL